MGVPIQFSNAIRSDLRIPIPSKLNNLVGQDAPDGTRFAFWHTHDSLKIAFLANIPMGEYGSFSNNDFSFRRRSEYIGEKHADGAWDIRPVQSVKNNIRSRFQEDDYAYLLFKDKWLRNDLKGFYIMTTSDLPRRLPALTNLRNYFPEFFRPEKNFDVNRPQEEGHALSIQTRSLVALFERSGLTNIGDVVDQIYTTGYIETDLELPYPV